VNAATGGWHVVTVRRAALLVADPTLLLTTHRNLAPLSAAVVMNMKSGEVAPAMLLNVVLPALARCHWNESVPQPQAWTLTVAVPPTGTVIGTGWTPIVGGVLHPARVTRKTTPPVLRR